MITEQQAEAAIHWIKDNAKKAGEVAAQRDYMQEWVKVERANIMAMFVGMSNAAAETEAMRHPRYLEALQAKKEADAAHVEMNWKKAAAEAQFECWRTQQSNQRALGKL